MNWKMILVLVLLMLLVIFTAQNYETIEIRLLLWSFKTSIAIIIFATLLIGIVIGWILSYIVRSAK